MAIALTSFQGLCGFRPIEEIVTFLTSKAGQNAESMHIGPRMHGQPRAELDSGQEQRLNVTGTEGLVGLMNS